MHILIVDDEQDICEVLSFNLENEGYEIDVAHSVEEALSFDLSKYNLFLLDVMMGGMSGYKFARLLKQREDTSSKPIIFITAKTTENDVLTGFSVGADDYIVKPFSIRQVIARVQVALRRSQKPEELKVEILSFKKLRLDIGKKKLFVNNEERILTKKEFEILLLLLRNQAKVFTREEILSKVWEDDVLVLDRTVDVNITRLRKKIIPYDKHLITRQGYGYSFETIDSSKKPNK